jgi:hypothetical protein
MPEKQKDLFSFGAEMGDTFASKAVDPHLLALRRIMWRYFTVPYTDPPLTFDPVLRVDGDLWYWQFEGCQKLRLMRKQGYITVDIGMPRNRCENVQPYEIRQYLMSNLKKCFQMMVAKLKKEKIPVDDKRLFGDLAKVEREYFG